MIRLLTFDSPQPINFEWNFSRGRQFYDALYVIRQRSPFSPYFVWKHTILQERYLNNNQRYTQFVGRPIGIAAMELSSKQHCLQTNEKQQQNALFTNMSIEIDTIWLWIVPYVRTKDLKKSHLIRKCRSSLLLLFAAKNSVEHKIGENDMNEKRQNAGIFLE